MHDALSCSILSKSSKELDTIADLLLRWDLSTNTSLSDAARDAEMQAARAARGKRRKQAIADAQNEADAMGQELDMSMVVMPAPVIPPQTVARLIQAAHQGDSSAQQVRARGSPRVYA